MSAIFYRIGPNTTENSGGRSILGFGRFFFGPLGELAGSSAGGLFSVVGAGVDGPSPVLLECHDVVSCRCRVALKDATSLRSLDMNDG